MIYNSIDEIPQLPVVEEQYHLMNKAPLGQALPTLIQGPEWVSPQQIAKASKVIRVLMIGDMGVGKSTLMRYLQTGNFDWRHYTTSGYTECRPGGFRTGNGVTVRVEAAEYNGEHRWGVATKAPYDIRKFDFVFFMFELTCRQSYWNLRKHYKEFQRLNPGNKTPKILVGTKCLSPVLKLQPTNRGVAWHLIGTHTVKLDFWNKLRIPFVYIDVRYQFNVRGLMSILYMIRHKDKQALDFKQMSSDISKTQNDIPFYRYGRKQYQRFVNQIDFEWSAYNTRMQDEDEQNPQCRKLIKRTNLIF